MKMIEMWITPTYLEHELAQNDGTYQGRVAFPAEGAAEQCGIGINRREGERKFRFKQRLTLEQARQYQSTIEVALIGGDDVRMRPLLELQDWAKPEEKTMTDEKTAPEPTKHTIAVKTLKAQLEKAIESRFQLRSTITAVNKNLAAAEAEIKTLEEAIASLK
jgi:hypothetical protein